MTRKLIYEALEKLQRGKIMKADVMDVVDAYTEAILQQANVVCSTSHTLADSFGKCTPNVCSKRTSGGCDLGVCFLDAHSKNLTAINHLK